MSSNPMDYGPLLIIGQSGQLATDLMNAATCDDVDALAIGRPTLDVTKPESIARLFERITPRAVINASAYTNVDQAESEPDLAFAINVTGAQALACVCANIDIPFIHVSTDQVFDGIKSSSYTEDDAPNPLCVYGQTKYEGEQRVLEAYPQALIVRTSWVYGPSGNNFVTKVLEWARRNKELSIVCDQIGKPTYSPDLAKALLELVARMLNDTDKPQGLLHLAGYDAMSRFEQAQAILSISQARNGVYATVKPVLTRDFPTPATRPLNAVLDCTRAYERYGITLSDFKTGLAATLDAIL